MKKAIHIYFNDNDKTDALFRGLKNAELILKQYPASIPAKQRVERYKQRIKQAVANGNA